MFQIFIMVVRIKTNFFKNLDKNLLELFPKYPPGTIMNNIPNAKVNGSMEKRIAGNLNIRFPGFSNEAIMATIPEIAISSGAACTTSIMEPSHVLLALGLSKDEAYSSLRFGIGRFNTEKDLEIAAESINHSLKKLTEMSYV